MIFNPTAECMPISERKELQLKKLRETVARAYKNCEFYRNKMDQAGVKPEDIQTLEDISKLPFTTKDTRFANVGRVGSPLFGDDRRDKRRHYSKRIRIRTFHRRFGNPSRRTNARSNRHSDFCRKHTPPPSNASRFQNDNAHLHPVLRPLFG